MMKVGGVAKGEQNRKYAYIGKSGNKKFHFLNIETDELIITDQKHDTSGSSYKAVQYRKNIIAELPTRGQKFVGNDDNEYYYLSNTDLKIHFESIDRKYSYSATYTYIKEKLPDINEDILNTYNPVINLKAFKELTKEEMLKTAFSVLKKFYANKLELKIIDIGHISKGNAWYRKDDSYYNIIGVTVKYTYKGRNYYDDAINGKVGFLPIYVAKHNERASIVFEESYSNDIDKIQVYTDGSVNHIRMTEKLFDKDELIHTFNRMDKTAYEIERLKENNDKDENDLLV